MNRLLTTTSVLLAAGGGGPVVDPGQIIEFKGSVSTTNTASLTYSSAPLGSAVSGRMLYVVCSYFDGSSVLEAPTSVTLDGNNATLIASVHEPSASTCGLSIWAYQDDGALGASTDVVVSHPTTRNSLSVAVVEASAGDDNLIDSVSDATMSASITADDLTTAGSKCLLYVCMSQNGGDPTAPSPFTDGQATFDENSDEWVCIAWDNDPSGSVESVDIPAADMGLRAAYLAVALD